MEGGQGEKARGWNCVTIGNALGNERGGKGLALGFANPGEWGVERRDTTRRTNIAGLDTTTAGSHCGDGLGPKWKCERACCHGTQEALKKTSMRAASEAATTLTGRSSVRQGINCDVERQLLSIFSADAFAFVATVVRAEGAA